MWRDAVPALTELAAAIGIAPDALQLIESRDRLSYSEDPFQASRLPSAEEFGRLLQRLVDTFGASLTLQFTSGSRLLFSLAPDTGYKLTPLGAFLKEVGAEPSIGFNLEIDKTALLKHWKLEEPELCAFHLFLFPEALTRALEVPLTALEKLRGEDRLDHGLLADLSNKSRVVIFVPAHDIALSGDHLAILGGDAVAHWNDYVTAAEPGQDIYLDVRDRLNWVGFDLETLRPAHLKAGWKNRAPARDDAIAAALYAQWTTCCLLYLADQSRWDRDTKSWLLTFPADKYVARATVGHAASVREALQATGDPLRAAEAIEKLTRTIYEDKKYVRDRLTVARTVVADVVVSSDAAASGRELIRRGSEIVSRFDIAWATFISKKLDQYFGQLRQLEELVGTTTRGYDEQIQTLTKTLTDNMLAAVAVVVGSFIAAMFKSPFQPFVFRFGAGVYVVYLLVFPIAVGLTATYLRFSAWRAAFVKRKEDFIKRLDESQVNEIVGDTVKKREDAFDWWFLTTIYLYLVVLVALIAAIIYVPGRIAQ